MAYRFKQAAAQLNRFYLSEDGIRVCAGCFRLPLVTQITSERLWVCEACRVEMCSNCTALHTFTLNGAPQHLFFCRACHDTD